MCKYLPVDEHEPEFPFVVKHMKLNRIGVAFRLKFLGGYPYYSVSNIQAPEGVSSWAAWSRGVCVVMPDIDPVSLGWKPREKVDFYVRNVLTGAVAKAYSDSRQHGQPAWGIEMPDGRKTSRWLKKYSVEITKEEYDAADKTIGHDALNRNAQYRRRAEKAKPGHDRTCRMCGRSCWPNWFYCPTCHGIVSSEHDWGPENDGSMAGI